MKKSSNHHPLVGKTAKLTKIGVNTKSPFKVGYYKRSILYDYCYRDDEYQISFEFVNEPIEKHNNVEFYCLKEIGKHASGDWHWFTLNQLMICDE